MIVAIENDSTLYPVIALPLVVAGTVHATFIVVIGVGLVVMTDVLIEAGAAGAFDGINDDEIVAGSGPEFLGAPVPTELIAETRA